MTMADNAQEQGYLRLEKLTKSFNRTVKQAQAVIFTERAWPRIVPLLYVGGTFLTASWLGAWDALPHQARMASVLALATAAVAAPLWVTLRGKSLFVNKEDAYDRLDDNMGEGGKGAARKVSDTLHESHNGLSQGLFQKNLERLWDKYEGRFKAGMPDINWKGFQGSGVVLAAALTVASAFYAGQDHYAKLTDAFNWDAPIPPLELTASITPPRGLDLKPVYLTGEGVDIDNVTIHEKSILTIYTFDRPSKVLVNGQAIEVINTIESGDRKTFKREIVLEEPNITVSIENGPQWQFSVNQDNAPQAEIKSVAPNDKEPSNLTLQYTAKDDYGIRNGEITIRVPNSDPATGKALPSSGFPKIALPY